MKVARFRRESTAGRRRKRIAGLGETGQHGGQRGQSMLVAKVEIRASRSEVSSRRCGLGDRSVPLTYPQAALGTHIELKGIDDKTLKLSAVPARARSRGYDVHVRRRGRAVH